MDLFKLKTSQIKNYAPLADRMRPQTFEEFVGQEEVIGQDKPLRKILSTGNMPSLIFWGPPGSGKTTLAKIIANATGFNFVSYSAVAIGTKEVKSIIDIAKANRGISGKGTILFLDEFHRFNRTQQDTFLPYIEKGEITLIGATTENPSFEINSALLSRCRVFVLRQLKPNEIKIILERAIKDSERGLGHENLKFENGVLDFIVNISNGDARVALNILELAVFSSQRMEDSSRLITITTIKDAAQKRVKLYDRDREEHYNIISAFIKSMRGSNPDAAIYWLARMLESGEDPLFIARRMVIFASEDIGNADPQALVVAVAAKDAVDFVGMPEGFLPLSQAVIYLATAPKSNSAYMTYLKAKEDVEKIQNMPVPLHLRNPVTDLMGDLGYGKNLKYPHNYPDAVVNQQYLPDNLKGKKYYEPKDIGFEKEIKRRMEARKSKLNT